MRAESLILAPSPKALGTGKPDSVLGVRRSILVTEKERVPRATVAQTSVDFISQCTTLSARGCVKSWTCAPPRLRDVTHSTFGHQDTSRRTGQIGRTQVHFSLPNY
jgi:hypothetical protein